MPQELPSNIPIVKDGVITIHIYRGALWVDHPIPIKADILASAFKYGEMWLQETARRYPRSTIQTVSIPGDMAYGGAVVDVSLGHTNQEETMRDVLRIGQEVYGQRHKWLVWRGTKEAKRLLGRYQKVAEVPESVDSGSETEGATGSRGSDSAPVSDDSL